MWVFSYITILYLFVKQLQLCGGSGSGGGVVLFGYGPGNQTWNLMEAKHVL